MIAGRTVIVDYGLCNIDSITRALEELGADVERTRDPRALERADRIVLPGVGAFAAAMRSLDALGLTNALRARMEGRDIPFLGICLGMHLMAERGLEHGDTPGLGLVPGIVDALVPTQAGERIPHIGWNEVHPQGDQPLFAGIPPGSDFYFVHSFKMELADPAARAASTPYCGTMTSALSLPGTAICATQFHPEKSQRHGRALLRNFLSL